MKLQKKTKVIYKDGYLVTKKGKLCMPAREVVRKLNHLDRLYQMACKAKDVNVKLEAIGSVDRSFTPRSEHEVKYGFKVETPNLDKAIKRSLKVMQDIDRKEVMGHAQEVANAYADVLQFADGDEYLVEDHTMKFDLPFLGNPIFLTEEKLIDLIVEMSAVDISNLDVD